MSIYALQSKERETIRRIKKGLDYSESSYVFLGERTNKVLSPLEMTKNFARIRKHIPEIGNLTVHSLRHTNASMKLKTGANIPTISRDLGHSTPVITSKIYLHVDTEDRKTATDKMEEKFGNMEYKRAVQQ